MSPSPLKKTKPAFDVDAAARAALADLDARGLADDAAVLAWLAEAAKSVKPVKDLARFRTTPVGVREFIVSPAFMKADEDIWPKVMDSLEELCSGKYTECVLTGGIGVAKTTLALYCQAYQVYYLSCLRDPHREFDLGKESEIVIIFQSLNASLAKAVDYLRFRRMIEKAPYFRRHFDFDHGFESEMKFPRNIVVKPISGLATGAIGQNVIGGIIDEVDFQRVIERSKLASNGGTYDQAAENYDTIASRRKSRYMKMGALPGMLCLVSSKNYPGGLTDRKQAEARDNPLIYVYDKRRWDIAKEGTFTGEMFPVFVGDETRKPRILENRSDAPLADQHLVVDIPVEYRLDFNNNLIKSIRDIAGYATQAMHPFILESDKVRLAFGKTTSILTRESCDFVETKVKVYPDRIQHREEPRFAHVDLARTGDSAGLAVGFVPGFKQVNRGDFQEVLPIVQLDFALEIPPPKGGEILFENIRRVLYTLRDVYKLPIRYVTFDTYQSADSIQIMATNGFLTDVLSCDKTTGPYDMTKQAIYDERLIAPTHEKAVKEFCALEFDVKKQKVDHPPAGSKDVSDAIAGVVWGLTMRREIWSRHKISMQRVPASIGKIIDREAVAREEQARAMPSLDEAARRGQDDFSIARQVARREGRYYDDEFTQ